MSAHKQELVQTSYSMLPYISFSPARKRKYPYRVMGYDTKRNKWFIWDTFATLELAESGLKKAMRQYKGGK